MEKVKMIERSLITTYRKGIYSCFIKAINEYELVKENDKICVCISGGKDSMVLAKLFQELQRHSSLNFEVEYVVMNPGYNNEILKQIKGNLELLNIDATIVSTNIFEESNKCIKNPCYICAKLRRGALYRIAKEKGGNKIALGHHYDDVIETTLMSMLTNGSFQTMLPKLKSTSFEGMELIRPLYLVRERYIINWARYNGLSFINCACSMTKREDSSFEGQRKKTKRLIQELKKYHPNVEDNIFASSKNVNLNMILGYKKDEKEYSFLDIYDKE